MIRVPADVSTNFSRDGATRGERPGACALQFRGQQLTYADLNERANGVAHQLRETSVGPERFVGLSIERSADAVLGLLGILKAGAAYVYLDPTYPAERLRAMADDCMPALVMDRIVPGSCADAPISRVTPDSDAYLIYTSGSSGTPKGTIEIHRSLTARLSAYPLPDIQEADRCALNSSLSFWNLGISTISAAGHRRSCRNPA